MGWFETKKASGIIIGDEPLDTTHQFLKDLARIYEEGCERKPTLGEVIALIESGLKFSGSECISDLQEHAVTQVVVKTTKKRKDQSFKAGDVFAIAIDKDLFAFGRILYLARADGMLIEIFRDTSPSRSYRPSIIESGRLFGPVRMTGGGLSLKVWRWTVVASDENFSVSDTELSIDFSYFDPAGGRCAVRFRTNDVRSITEEEAKRIEDGVFWRPELLEERIRMELRQQR